MGQGRIKQRIKLVSIVVPFISILASLIIGAFILLAIGANPFEAYGALIKGAFGNLRVFGDTLARTTPIIFTGLAVALAFRGGFFNIGVEGQLLMGAFASAFVGYAVVGLSPVLHVTLAVLAGAAAGGLWALLPGLLKAVRGANEVIITIMLNYVAYSLTGYFIQVTTDTIVPKTPDILPSAVLPRIAEVIPAFGRSNLSFGIIIALFICVLIYYVLRKTVLGFEIKAIGRNSLAANSFGINVKKNIIIAFIISGAIAGIGGAERVLGVQNSFMSGISPGYGFEGIAVALLAGNNVIGIILSALLFGALSSGGLYMNMSADVPVHIVSIIQALVILFAAINDFIKQLFQNRVGR